MATIQVKKCPKCGCVYERNSYAGRPSKDNRTKYGSPLKQCLKCKNIFIDSEYREIAIDGIREVDTKVISPAGIFYSVMSLFIAICSFAGGYSPIGIFFIIGALYLSLNEILSYKRRQEALKKYAQESEKRMQNLQYAQLLKTCGHYVPDKYLYK